jgi:hypothetical protein
MFAALGNEAGAAGAITPEMLAKNVSDAVGQAVGQAIALAITQVMAGFQQAQAVAPQPAIAASVERAVVNAAYDFRARSPEGPMVVHGDSTVLQQLRRDMGIDDFVFDDSVFAGARPGLPACAPFDAIAFTQQTVAPSLGAIRSAEVSERDPAAVLGAWSEELKWLAAEIGHVRAPEAETPEWSRGPATGADNLSPQSLPARVGGWLAAASDLRPRLASLAADTTAWLCAGTSNLFEPLRGSQVRVRTWMVWLAGASTVLRAIGKG